MIADAFRPLIAELASSEQYECIHYRRQGYGQSSPLSTPVPIERQAADCAALIRHLGIDTAHVVGHSYGGSIALQLAHDAPEVVATLALLEPAMFVGTSATENRAALAQASRRDEVDGGAAVLHAFLHARWADYRPTLDREIPGGFDQGTRDAGTFLRHEIPSLMAWQFGQCEASRMSQPTLSVLGGENDTPSSRFTQVHQALLTWIPDAEGKILPGLTHFLHVQSPGGVAETLERFWSDHSLTDQ